MKKGKLRWVSWCVAAAFFVSIPFAVFYAKNFQRMPDWAQAEQDIVIEVAAVDCPKYLTVFRRAAAQYNEDNRNVRFFVLNMTRLQLDNQNFGIVIVNNDGILSCSVASYISETAAGHCIKYLERLMTEKEIVFA